MTKTQTTAAFPLSVPLVLAVVAAFVLGWAAAFGFNAVGDRPVRFDGFLSGAISQVDASGSALCVIPDGRTVSEQHCSLPLQRPGSPKLQVGQRIAVAVEWIRTGKDSSREVFVVYDPPPSP